MGWTVDTNRIFNVDKQKIMIVEDDLSIASLIKYNLQKDGFTCSIAGSGEEGFRQLDHNPVNLIVLDLMLPKMDGFEFLERLKQDDKLARTHVLILTCKSEELDRIRGYELGADDYVLKPFNTRELILRIKAILRSDLKEQTEETVLSAGDLRLDTLSHTLKIKKKTIDLSVTEFKLMKILMKEKGYVQSREKLLNSVWDLNPELDLRIVDTYVCLLRKKLGRAGRYIETVPGFGYRIRDN